MSRRLGILVCLVALVLSPNYVMTQRSEQAHPPVTQHPRPGMSELVKMPVVYRVPGMDKVVVKSNLKYTHVNEPQLLMDVYIPPRLGEGERRPAALFIHGSVPAGSPAKNMGLFQSWGRLVAASGMVGVTFTHRLGYPKPSLAEAASDVSTAINYIRAQAASLNIDRDRICLVAYSGGGPLLSTAMGDKPAYVRCLVAFYAFLDIRQSELHTAHESAEVVKAFSPITHLTGDVGNIAPMFIARAGLDEIPGMNDSIDGFIREAISKNAAIIVANHPRGVHGFDVATDNDRSREIIRSVLTFMKAHLGIREAQ